MERDEGLVPEEQIAGLKKTPIWIVDDSVRAYYYLQEGLTDDGYKVQDFENCSDAERAIRYVKSQGEPKEMPLPRIVLMDVTVPRRADPLESGEKGFSHGVRSAREISELSPSTRIIVWSGYNVQSVMFGWGFYYKSRPGVDNLLNVLENLGGLLPYEDSNLRLSIGGTSSGILDDYIRNYWSKYK